MPNQKSYSIILYTNIPYSQDAVLFLFQGFLSHMNTREKHTHFILSITKTMCCP